jgi:diguanylate cyclase (GGDEF)-like protein
VSLTRTAAQVMGLAQDGRSTEALTLGERALEDAVHASPTDQAALWYALSVAQHVAGDNAAAFAACDRCLALATEADDAGWVSNALSMRAMALARQDRVEPALIDLARAEVELAACDDAGLLSWGHTGLGYTYLELRLYELAEPHMVRAQELAASPIPLPNAPVIDLCNLAELHLRWADELERISMLRPSPDEVAAHRKEGHVYAERAVALALEQHSSFLGSARSMELCSRPWDDPTTSLDALREAFAQDGDPEYQGSRATVGGALARALWARGERDEAVEVAREAAGMSLSASDWQVTANSQWLLVEMQAQAGVPGAAAGRSYAALLSRVLWKQRLSTLQGARAALQVERLHRDNAVAQREALEDPLTGVGNRRALDEALRMAATEPGLGAPDGDRRVVPETSLLVVDLDDFKTINDTYGHVVGDEVLRTVAMAIRGVARADDTVARLGGDEFVVLARGADTATGERLAERVTAAIRSLVVGTSAGPLHLAASVGVATTSAHDFDAAGLLASADAAMYAVKNRNRTLRPPRPPG